MMRLSKWVGGTLLGIVLLLAGALLLLNTGVIGVPGCQGEYCEERPEHQRIGIHQEPEGQT